MAATIIEHNIDADQLFEAIIYLAENHELTQDNLNRVLAEGFWGAVPGMARAVSGVGNVLKQGAGAIANPLARGAQVVGGAIGRGAQAAGGAIGRGAQWAGDKALAGVDAVGQGAVDAGKFVGNSFKNVAVDSAKGIAQGAKAVGGAVKSGAQAVGDKVGQAAGAVAQGAKNAYQQGQQGQALKQVMDRIPDLKASLQALGVDPQQAGQMTLASIEQMVQQKQGGGNA